uniref:E3 ubiquitin ligase RNF4 n=1 Tax=Anthurium amnicola TaxID=1678845 RepID=A0A1D1Z4Z1_9ARAE
MNARVSSKRPSRRRASEANTNRGKTVLNVDANVDVGASNGRTHTPAPPAMAASAVPSPNQPVGQQPTAANSFIDVEAIEDDVQLLSSSRGFPQGRNQSRRNRPVTVVLDEDSDVQAGPSGASAKDPAVNYNRQKHPPKRTIVNCEVYESLEFGSKSKKRCAMNSTEPQNTAPKEPQFTCAICWGQLVEETSTICGHIFCQACIKVAIQTQKKCPTCRKSLTMKNIHRVYLPISN